MVKGNNAKFTHWSLALPQPYDYILVQHQPRKENGEECKQLACVFCVSSIDISDLYSILAVHVYE